MTDIASRNLKLNRDGVCIDVPVSVSWPIIDQSSWTCKWTIEWPDRKRSNVGCGIDAMQALVMALQMIGTEIYCSEEHRSGRLAWTEEANGYGFPVPTTIRDMLIGYDAKFL